MSNPKTADLVYTACTQSRKKPKAVVLGHLSNQRNTEQYAMGEMRRVYQQNETDMTFRLLAAPLYDPGKLIEF